MIPARMRGPLAVCLSRAFSTYGIGKCEEFFEQDGHADGDDPILLQEDMVQQ